MVVVVETMKSKSAISVFPSMTHQFDRWKDSLAVGQGRPQQKGSLAHQGRPRERGRGGDNPGPIEGEGARGAEEDQRQVGGKENPGCAGALSQPPPLPALPDLGEGEGISNIIPIAQEHKGMSV